MNDTKQMLKRARDQFEPPQDLMGSLVRRRDRKQRNKRISAGVVALVVAVAGIGTVLRAFDASPRTPATPTPFPLASNGDLTFVARDSSDFASLYLVDPDGGDPRKILDAGCPGNPDDPPSCEDVGISSVDWSPDGSRIAYTLWGPTPAGIGMLEGIYVMEIATEQVHQLTSCMDPCFLQTDLEWSPDGSRIAYTQVDVAGCDAAWAFSGSCSIYTMNADGTDRVKLSTESVVDPVNPSWSPDGTEIAFSARVGKEWFVYTMASDGSQPTRLAPDLPAPEQNQPAWSPDGSEIAFLAGGEVPNNLEEGYGDFDLWSIAPDGSQRRFLVHGCCMFAGGLLAVQGPEWSPDGTQILILGESGTRPEVIDAATTERSFVVEKAFGAIAWQPVP